MIHNIKWIISTRLENQFITKRYKFLFYRLPANYLLQNWTTINKKMFWKKMIFFYFSYQLDFTTILKFYRFYKVSKYYFPSLQTLFILSLCDFLHRVCLNLRSRLFLNTYSKLFDCNIYNTILLQWNFFFLRHWYTELKQTTEGTNFYMLKKHGIGHATFFFSNNKLQDRSLIIPSTKVFGVVRKNNDWKVFMKSVNEYRLSE